MYPPGIKASQLIIELQKQMAFHGDCECFAGGGDYPEGVRGVIFNAKGDAYHSKNSFKII